MGKFIFQRKRHVLLEGYVVNNLVADLQEQWLRTCSYSVGERYIFESFAKNKVLSIWESIDYCESPQKTGMGLDLEIRLPSVSSG